MKHRFQPGDKVRIINYPALSFSASLFYKKVYPVKECVSKNWYDGTVNAYILDTSDYASSIVWKEDWLELEDIDVADTEFDEVLKGEE